MDMDVSTILNKNSELVRVWDIPFSNFYQVEVTMPDKTFKTFEPVREYSDININGDGLIEVSLTYKDPRVGDLRFVDGKHVGRFLVRYPYYRLIPERQVLCAFKRFTHQKSNSFALNYELFRSDIDWKICCILHVADDGVPYLFISEREEWLAKGRVGEEKREIQIFLEMNTQSDVRLSAAQRVLTPKMQTWAVHCMEILDRKETPDD